MPSRLISWTAPNARALTTLLDMVDLVNAGQGAKFWPPLHVNFGCHTRPYVGLNLV